jgi:hypothetical protein
MVAPPRALRKASAAFTHGDRGAGAAAPAPLRDVGAVRRYSTRSGALAKGART